MEENGGSMVTKIRQIVKLKEFLNRWQNVTLGNNKGAGAVVGGTADGGGRGGISPAIIKRLKSSSNKGRCDSDEDSCNSPEPPFDVPKGYLAVYVGTDDHRRFIIPTCYLSDPLFKLLLEKVEEEFGFDLTGGLTIPCEVETFKYLLQCIESRQKQHPLALNNNHNHNNNNSDGTSQAVEEECRDR